MVALIFITLFAAGEPFTWEVPDTVEVGETFNLTITSLESGCTGITTGNINISPGLLFRGSSSSTSVSTVTTHTGRHLSQVLVYQMRFTATDTGVQTIGPLAVNLGGIGSFSIDEVVVNVTGTPPSTGGGGTSPTALVWLEGELRDPGGRIYPGTRLVLDYYIYARIGVENVTYWWTAPEMGVIRHVETIPDSNWEALGKRDNSSRSKLAVVEMTPAAAGSLYAPLFTADVTGMEYNPWGKVYAWTVENDPIILPVYPFPENPPSQWDGTLLDSVFVHIEQLPVPPGQGGELTFRLTCMGPGSIYMDTPPALDCTVLAEIIPTDEGSAENKKWWDYVLEPDETGCHVIRTDTLIWLDRNTGSYRTSVTEPCSLVVSVIPRTDIPIELADGNGGFSSLALIIMASSGVLLLTVMLGIAARRKDRRLASVTSAEDLDELLTGLENELSHLLAGKREYMGFEELDEFLDRCDTDSLLARRILRFWKDLELSISDREVTGNAFQKLKRRAEELLKELHEDLERNNQ